MRPFTESIVQDAAFGWFGELGYGLENGPQLAVGEANAGRESFGDFILVGRLREAIRRLNPAITEEARVTVRQYRSVQNERRTNP